jgi:hypothetical protein
MLARMHNGAERLWSAGKRNASSGIRASNRAYPPASTAGKIGPEALCCILIASTNRNHSHAPSITRHHALAEERALIVTRRDSVPVRKSTVVIVPIAVYEREATKTSSVESSSMEAAAVDAASAGVAAVQAATTSAIDSVALETGVLGRRRVCTECSEGA